jgi:hypothetical protein
MPSPAFMKKPGGFPSGLEKFSNNQVYIPGDTNPNFKTSSFDDKMALKVSRKLLTSN